MEELPLALLDGVPDAECEAVQRWWGALSPADQRTVAELADERQAECFFGRTDDAEPPPLVFGGRFLPHDDAWQFAAWETDWREYLIDHPDVVIAAQFRTKCYLGDWARCRVVDWGLTRFAIAERPPSEQRQAEPGAAADPAS